MSIIIFIIALILFVGLVALHELGHAIVALRNKVKVEEYGIGFPPRMWGKKLKNGMLFSLNWLPLGGFVKLKGESDDASGPGTFGAAPLKAKAKILLAGVAVNWITAVIIFTLLALFGLPRLVDGQFTVGGDTKTVKEQVLVGYVAPDSPAASIGLEAGDQILQIAGQPMKSADDVTNTAKFFHGNSVSIEYARDGQAITDWVQLNADNSAGKGILGVQPLERVVRRSTWSAPIVGVGVTAQLTGLTFQGIGNLLANTAIGIFKVINPNGDTRQNGREHLQEAGDNVSGPLGIFILLKQVSADGFGLILYLIAVISLSLAVMNTLPIPALDGGRLFVMLLYRARHKKLTKETEEKIHGYGFMALLGLIVIITIVDAKRFF